MPYSKILEREAEKISKLLGKTGEKLVLVESCTGGLVAFILTSIPGISRYFCGSFVVYRDSSKEQWLGLSKSFLKKNSDVSEITSEKLALQALSKTREASVSLAITGHLGPHSPRRLDGRCFVSLAYRGKMHRKKNPEIFNHALELDESRFRPNLGHITQTVKTGRSVAFTLRQERRLIASHECLSMVRTLLERLH